MASTEDKLIVSGFGDVAVNGTYYYEKDFNGYGFYRKDASTFIAYHVEYGPYSFAAGYYIFRMFERFGSAPVYSPRYRVPGTDPEATGWVSLLVPTSAQTATGTVTLDLGSSSSVSTSSESEGNVSSSSSSSTSSSTSSESEGNVSSSSSSTSSSSSSS